MHTKVEASKLMLHHNAALGRHPSASKAKVGAEDAKSLIPSASNAILILRIKL
jgi:hypothetical protein